MKPRLLNRHHREATIQLLYSVCCIVHAMRQLQLQRACSDAQMLLLSVVLSGVVLVVAGEVAQVPHYPRGMALRVAIPPHLILRGQIGSTHPRIRMPRQLALLQ